MYLCNITRKAHEWIEKLVVELESPERGGRTLIGIMIFYSASWTIYAVASKSSQGIHPDMGEIFVWGQNLDWGTPKHPPLLPALVRLWFSVFPVSEWAYYLLAVLVPVVAIYFSWLLSGHWLRDTKRASVPFLLMLVPFYNFLALKLDHNTILVPLWAATTYAFVNSFETRSVKWSLLTGVLAGIAVLAKYWSFFLLLGLGLGALIDSRRIQFLKSPAPWIITIVSFILFLPHILWLEANNYPTFVYGQIRLSHSTGQLWLSLIKYVFGALGYVATPLLLVTILAVKSKGALKDTLFPADGHRRFAVAIFYIPILAALPFTLITHIRLLPLWIMSGLSLFGVVLLSSPLVQLTRRSTTVIATLAIALSIGALVVSPLVAYWKLIFGADNHANYSRSLAAEVQKQWRDATPEPLHNVGSTSDIANSVAFYLDKALPIPLNARTQPKWNTSDYLDKFGIVLICPQASLSCRKTMGHIELGRIVERRVETEIQSHWLGFTGKRERFVIDIVIPVAGTLSARDKEFKISNHSR